MRAFDSESIDHAQINANFKPNFQQHFQDTETQTGEQLTRDHAKRQPTGLEYSNMTFS